MLGGGGSGLVAAVKAAERGHKVIVLEKGKKCGGSTTLAHGFMGSYTQFHRKYGAADGRQTQVDRIYQQVNGQVDYDLLKKSVWAVNDMFDWLVDFGGWEDWIRVGVQEKTNQAHAMGADLPDGKFLRIDFPQRCANKKCTDHAMGPGWLGTYTVQKMLEQCQKLDVEILLETGAKELKRALDGRFCAVIAEAPGGEVRIEAKACVIATGGFAHDDDSFQQVNPGAFEGIPVKRLSCPTATGDGMKLVRTIDGQVNLDDLHCRANAGGPLHHPYSFTVVGLALSTNPIVDNNGYIVDLPPGRRANLDEYPNCAVYTIMDIDTVHKCGQARIEDDDDETEIGHDAHVHYLRELDYESTLGYPVRKAWTIEGLAEKIGCNAETLKKTIDDFNDKMDREGPPDVSNNPMAKRATWAKVVKPPFYAVTLLRFNEAAGGGVVINNEMEVLDNSNQVIPGLFAAGDSCCGPYMKNGGFAELSWAMASGFMSGDAVSAY
ncbi:MAG: FAD-dependent oxidoreductase, partial [Bacteroides sp.]|nr:FAD-dependent oxidoreductase [Bacteroides sp.]